MFDGTPETTWASFTQGAVTALALVGNNLKFTRLKIMGFGTLAGREAFPFHILNRARTPLVGNVLLEDCLFAEPAAENADGITTAVVSGNGGSLTNAVIRRCTVRGLRPHFRYSHGFGANLVEDSVVEDCGEAIYFEPDHAIDDLGPVLVRSNRFVNVDHGFLIRFHPGRQFGPITSVGNEIVLAEQGGGGFFACDLCGPGPSGTITNVTFLNNIVRYADWLPRPANTEGGLHYSDIGNALFINNIVHLGTRSSLRVRQCPAGWLPPPPVEPVCPASPTEPAPQQGSYPRCLDILPEGYRRVWSNNRDLSGLLIPVRFFNAGVDGLAAQQQQPPDLQ
jgi:hypothetical protein